MTWGKWLCGWQESREKRKKLNDGFLFIYWGNDNVLGKLLLQRATCDLVLLGREDLFDAVLFAGQRKKLLLFSHHTALYADFAHFFGYLQFLLFFAVFSAFHTISSLLCFLRWIFTIFLRCFSVFVISMAQWINFCIKWLHCMLILHIFMVICYFSVIFYCFSLFSFIFTPFLRYFA